MLYKRGDIVERNEKGQFMKGGTPWNKDTKGIMGINLKRGKTYEEMYGIERAKKMRRKSREIHLDRFPANNKYSVDRNYFKEINSQDKAYWLGYIAADGCIDILRKGRPRGGRLTWGSIDLQPLKDFAQDVSFTGSIYKAQRSSKPYYILAISDKRFAISLMDKGIVPRKSLILKFPDFLNRDLISHFCRGYLDGDGCISVGKTKKGYTWGTLSFISGSYRFLEEMRIVIENELGMVVEKIYKKKGGNTFTLKFGGKKAYEVGRWLYRDANRFLKRKYDKYLELKSIVDVWIRREEDVYAKRIMAQKLRDTGLSSRRIGKILGVSKTFVLRHTKLLLQRGGVSN